MSEDFDKEAEREKLEEKYERDKEKRQATEQMSELLLQGATMTNAHCSECGDPIFRYEGQEFCPTCEKPVDRGGNETEDGEDETGDSDSIQVTTPSDDARVSFGGDGQAPEQSQDDEQPPSEEGNGQQPDQPATAPEQQPSPEDPRRVSETAEQPRTQRSAPQLNQPAQSTDQGAQPSRSAQSPSAPGAATTGEASVSAARESLVQTLTRFSQQAAATEDPSRAQEHLAAAREAAEALAALRQ